MQRLRDALRKAQDERAAIGHFNIADLILLKAVFAAARELNVPVLVVRPTENASLWVLVS